MFSFYYKHYLREETHERPSFTSAWLAALILPGYFVPPHPPIVPSGHRCSLKKADLFKEDKEKRMRGGSPLAYLPSGVVGGCLSNGGNRFLPYRTIKRQSKLVRSLDEELTLTDSMTQSARSWCLRVWRSLFGYLCVAFLFQCYISIAFPIIEEVPRMTFSHPFSLTEEPVELTVFLYDYIYSSWWCSIVTLNEDEDHWKP